MKIFVMRHGEAEMMAKSDKTRPLTGHGELQAFNQGQWLRSFIPEFDKVLTSPYSRAMDTFTQINVAYEQALTDKQEIWDGITPYGNSELVSDYLALLSDHDIQTVLLISHLPLVGEIIAELCGKNSINFYPATIAEVEWDTEIGKVVQSKTA
ncbi:MAG TPA: phosphohistidine phosphatase SixA [Pasteurellaceae bacterium]|nr:phosphohistidine phosphatase SixA [Pasteurellaceae bacterium]